MKMSTPEKGDYPALVPCRVSVETVIRMMTAYTSEFATWTGQGTRVTDMAVRRVTTGYGSHTTHHWDDSDYIVTFDVLYADRRRWYECVMGIHNGEISVFLN